MRKNLWPHVSFNTPKTYLKFRDPLTKIMSVMTPVESKGNRPFQMKMENFLDSLIYYHLVIPDSGRHLLQHLEQDTFARKIIAPPEGIKKSSFFEAMHSRNTNFLIQVFNALSSQAALSLPEKHKELGDLVSIDGTLIDATLSMTWADYRKNSKKAKAHLGFDLNRSIPTKLTLTTGKGDERKEFEHLLLPGQTGVADRYYQCHKYFDYWQSQGIHFVCRIRDYTCKKIINELPVKPESHVFYDAMVTLGSTESNYTKYPVRVVGYFVGNDKYWIATDRLDLSAEQIANIYLLRWKIEIFFGWWKRHLNVYHLIARSSHALLIQLLSGLITYLLLALYCNSQFQEKVSIQRLRELRIAFRNEAALFIFVPVILNFRALFLSCAKT